MNKMTRETREKVKTVAKTRVNRLILLLISGGALRNIPKKGLCS